MNKKLPARTLRAMSWDEELSENYEEWSASMTADVDFYVDLAHQTPGPLVELAIGNGRVAVPVATATWRTVIGLDTSSAMLDQARANAAAAAAAGVQLDLRLADMRDLALAEPADLGRSASDLRGGGRQPGCGRLLCLERLRLRPRRGHPLRWPAPGHTRGPYLQLCRR